MELLAATDDSPCESGFNSCSLLWRITDNEGLATDGGAVVDRIFHVLVIVVAALVLRWLVNRSIAKIIQRVTTVRGPQAISDLAERLSASSSRRESIVGDRTARRADTLTSVLQHIASIVIWTVAFMLVLSVFEVNLAPILASAGIAGVAIGFGAQNLVQDYLAGIFILLEDQYGVGDWVDVGDASGEVVDMGLRVTTLRALDGTLWYVRNGQIMRVGNSSQSWAYVVVDTPLPPTVDVDLAGAKVIEAAQEFAADERWSRFVLAEPEYLGPTEVTIDQIMVRLGVRTVSDEQWAAGRELRRRISEALREAGITTYGARVYVPRDTTGPTALSATPAYAPNGDDRRDSGAFRVISGAFGVTPVGLGSQAVHCGARWIDAF